MAKAKSGKKTAKKSASKKKRQRIIVVSVPDGASRCKRCGSVRRSGYHGTRRVPNNGSVKEHRYTECLDCGQPRCDRSDPPDKKVT